MSRKSEYNNYFPENDLKPISIVGKSWDYRNPNNTEKIEFDSRGDDNYDGFMNTGSGNRDSFAFTNPLYKFSQGEVERTARSLGINTNIDEPEEVEKILAKLNGSFETKEDSDTEAEVDPPKLTQEDLGIANDEQRQEDIDRKTEEYNENFDDGLPWQASDPSETYDRVFNEAAEGGSKLTGAFGGFSTEDSVKYLNARAGDKKKSVAEYIDYGYDRDSLTVAENHNSAMDFIENMALLGVKPPELDDPKDSFDYYADQIRGAA